GAVGGSGITLSRIQRNPDDPDHSGIRPFWALARRLKLVAPRPYYELRLIPAFILGRTSMSAARAGGQSRHARPTMKDVAALAGVAIKTVSRVMNGDPTVAPDLAARIRDAAGKLGY